MVPLTCQSHHRQQQHRHAALLFSATDCNATSPSNSLVCGRRHRRARATANSARGACTRFVPLTTLSRSPFLRLSVRSRCAMPSVCRFRCCRTSPCWRLVNSPRALFSPLGVLLCAARRHTKADTDTRCVSTPTAVRRHNVTSDIVAAADGENFNSSIKSVLSPLSFLSPAHSVCCVVSLSFGRV